MSDVSQVLLEAEFIDTDVQTRIVCPFCQGGTTGERCMSIIRTSSGEIKFICHRANCGMAGRSHAQYRDTHRNQTTLPRPTRKVQLRNMSKSEQDLVWDAWGIGSWNGWRWDEITNRLAMPVYGPAGNLRGLVLRAMDNEVPKVLSVRWQENEPFVSWYNAPYVIGRNPEHVVLVEDIPSAVKTANVCQTLATVALNGTHISDDTILELQRNNATNKQLAIALDEDASVLALKYAHDMQAIFGRIKVILLDRDLKNMKDKEIQDCLRNALS